MDIGWTLYIGLWVCFIVWFALAAVDLFDLGMNPLRYRRRLAEKRAKARRERIRAMECDLGYCGHRYCQQSAERRYAS